SLVDELDGVVEREYERELHGLRFMPVRLSRHAIRAAAQFNPLRVIRPMPQLRPIPPAPIRAVAPSTFALSPAGPPESGERVAVFDGGIDATSPHLQGCATQIDLTSLPAEPNLVEHGTVVTSAVLFGHSDPGDALPAPMV